MGRKSKKGLFVYADGSKDRPVNNEGMNIIKCRELLQWKIPRQKVKCRVVLKGFQDRRFDLRTDSPTLRPESFRLIMTQAADFQQHIFAVDLKTAFLQGDEYTEENQVYFDPPEIFKQYFHIMPDEVCIALKSIYGLNDAPRMWYERLARTMQDTCQQWKG